MSFADSGFGQSPTTQSDNVYVLGQTGQTIIYMFPDGQGLAEREQPDFDAVSESSISSVDAEEQMLDDLLATGKITVAQKAVVLHDKTMTGMSLDEILTARGWL